MVREAKLSWNDLGRSSICETGLRKLWDDLSDVEEPLMAEETPDSQLDDDEARRNRSGDKKTAKRKNDAKNLADADWMNWS